MRVNVQRQNGTPSRIRTWRPCRLTAVGGTDKHHRREAWRASPSRGFHRSGLDAIEAGEVYTTEAGFKIEVRPLHK
jgi:hypothetical protein